MSVKERLKRYIKFKKTSNRALSLAIGMSENYVTNMRKSIQPDVIDKFAVYYPDLNTGWLMTGEGEMIRNPKEYGINKEDSLTKAEEKKFDPGCILCQERASMISKLEKCISDKDCQIDQLNGQIKHLSGQIEFLNHIIKSQCLDHPLPGTGTGPP